MQDFYQCQRLIQHAPSLCLEAYLYEDVLQLLKKFPVMQLLVVLDTNFCVGSFRLEYNHHDAVDDGRVERSGRSLLKQRFLDSS